MSTANKKPKQRKCRCGCGQSFEPRNTLQIAATPECAMKLAQKQRESTQRQAAKAVRKADREAKEKLKTRSDWMKEAQTAFNAFVRFRDRDQPCICCGQPLHSGEVGGQYDCGHYRSVGSAPHMRFDERNAHAQRKQCNRWGSGRAVDYRIGLIARIGLEAVEDLEADQSVRKWTIDELKAIRDEYRTRLRELQKLAGSGSIS